MKKRYCVMIAIILICSFLVGCGKSSTKQTDEQASDSGVAANQGTGTHSESEQSKSEQSKSEQHLIYDVDGVRAYYLDYIVEPLYGPQIRLYFENDKDIEVNVYFQDFSANGIMFAANLSVNVPAGGVATDSIFIHDRDFDSSGTTNVKRVEFVLRVINAKENYHLVSDPFLIDVVNS